MHSTRPAALAPRRRGACWLPMIHPINSPNIVPDTPNTIASRVMK
jgi:hypothetical protein